MQTNPLPPLPLIKHPTLAPDGALIFDNSTIELLRCPRLLENKWLRKRDLVASKAGRNFGSTLHAGWATRLRLCGSEEVSNDAQVAINESMRAWLNENPQPTDDFRNFDHACRVMAAYNAFYRKEPFRVLTNPKDGSPLVECTFCIPFGKVQGIEIYYAGKIDTAIEDHNGIWSFDHKSTFQFGDTFNAQMHRDGGQLGYFWALWQVLGRRPTGYLIDAVRIRKPKRSDEYAGIAPCDQSDFARIPFSGISDDAVEGWKRDVTQCINLILFMHDTGHFPEYRWNCTNKFGTCDMFDCCSLPPAQREQVLYNSTLFEEAVWSPLHLPETTNKESKENE